MKNLYLLFTLFFSLILISACSKKEPKPVKQTTVPDCIFPNTNVAAPGWICDEPVDGLDLQSVGIAEKSKAGIGLMKDIAATDGRARLATQMKVKVQQMIKNYAGTTGRGETETVDVVQESATKVITNQELFGSKIYKSRTGPNGRLFVLVGIKNAEAKKIAEQALQTSYKNDQALWQKFQAGKAFDEMKKDILDNYNK